MRRLDGTGTSLYECGASSGAGCLVELNGPALQDLLGTDPASVSVGTYNRVDVTYCTSGETGFRAFVTGTTSIGGTTYYTRTAGVLGTTSPAEPVAIDHQGSGNSYPISPPLVIADSTTATTVLRLYFDILNLVSTALPSPLTNPLWVPGWCTPVAPLGSAAFLCVASPEVIGVVGTTPPAIERYRVNDGGIIGLVFDASSDLFYGGYLRRYVDQEHQESRQCRSFFFANHSHISCDIRVISHRYHNPGLGKKETDGSNGPASPSSRARSVLVVPAHATP